MPDCRAEQAALNAADAAMDAWADEGPGLVADVATKEEALTDCEKGDGRRGERSVSSSRRGKRDAFQAELAALVAKYRRERR